MVFAVITLDFSGERSERDTPDAFLFAAGATQRYSTENKSCFSNYKLCTKKPIIFPPKVSFTGKAHLSLLKKQENPHYYQIYLKRETDCCRRIKVDCIKP
jgi:hypothetical protein